MSRGWGESFKRGWMKSKGLMLQTQRHGAWNSRRRRGKMGRGMGCRGGQEEGDEQWLWCAAVGRRRRVHRSTFVVVCTLTPSMLKPGSDQSVVNAIATLAEQFSMVSPLLRPLAPALVLERPRKQSHKLPCASQASLCWPPPSPRLHLHPLTCLLDLCSSRRCALQRSVGGTSC